MFVIVGRNGSVICLLSCICGHFVSTLTGKLNGEKKCSAARVQRQTLGSFDRAGSNSTPSRGEAQDVSVECRQVPLSQAGQLVTVKMCHSPFHSPLLLHIVEHI